MHAIWVLVAVVAATGGLGCITLKPVVVAPKTSLENELLGTFALLQKDLHLISVRPAVQKPSERMLALQTLLDRHVRAEELAALKDAGLVKEQPKGVVEVDVEALRQSGRAPEAVIQLVASENKDRQRLAEILVKLTAGLSPKDLPQVRQQVAELSLEPTKKTLRR